ncbi:MAG: lysylphosphatidylglycerol synthase transmembrane domain-containing protein [Paracoccaceae bacterium]|nr:lysylphosphatidylglycerol synthase transmembrane domain-containing protein [Paracoccaceae bacterium]
MALLIGLVLLVAFGLFGLAAATGWEETVGALRTLSLREMAILLALSLVNYLCRGLRWHMFATRLGLMTGFLQNMRHFLGGFAMSVTPGRVGELVRMRWIRRETGWSFEKTAPLVLVDRAADLAAMAILLALSLAFSASGIALGIPVALLAIAVAIVATRPKLLRWVGDIGHIASRRAFPRLFVRVRRAAQSLNAFTGPTVMILAGLVGVIGWLAEGYAFHMLLVWLGADIGLWKAVGIFIFATLAGGLTGAPGGLGGAEAAMVALLALDGVPLEVAVPATLVIRVTTLWFAILIGLMVFPMAERASQKAKHALENS